MDTPRVLYSHQLKCVLLISYIITKNILTIIHFILSLRGGGRSFADTSYLLAGNVSLFLSWLKKAGH